MLSTQEDECGLDVSVMKPEELAAVRAELLAFAGEMFTPLARADQRRWGEIYLRGLMVDGRRNRLWLAGKCLTCRARGHFEQSKGSTQAVPRR